jgi:hypothetical protein
MSLARPLPHDSARAAAKVKGAVPVCLLSVCVSVIGGMPCCLPAAAAP